MIRKLSSTGWRNYAVIVGIDEAGRGPLAGPVVAAAVILDKHRPIKGLADSKTMGAERREELAEIIKNTALEIGIGSADPLEIDQFNILQATLLAMERAVATLSRIPQYALVDGDRCPRLPCMVEAIVKGDSLVPVISAASIVAKVYRDREMLRLDCEYPGYGFAKHKGYATADHLDALRRLGACAIHRRGFSPVSDYIKL